MLNVKLGFCGHQFLFALPAKEKEERRMNIIITGVSSFIGCALARQLISEGYEVYGTVRPNSRHRERVDAISRLHVIECDTSECEKLTDMNLPKMYACVHLSWDGTSKEGRQNSDINKDNEANTLRMVRTAKELGCERFILSGSQAEYGVTVEKVEAGRESGEPVAETHPCNPLSEYGKSKLKMLEECSRLCSELEMTYIHLRIFSIYGEGDRETTLTSSCVKTFCEGGHIELTDCRQLWNMLNIKDCAKAISDLISCVFTVPEEGKLTDHVVNIASEDTRTLREFVDEIHQKIGKGSCEFTRTNNSPEGTPYLNPDITKLKKLTGFIPQISYSEGIENMERYFSGLEKS